MHPICGSISIVSALWTDKTSQPCVLKWIRHVCAFTPCIQLQDKQQQAECAEKLTAEVRWLEGQADEAGPFFLGPDFSLVDATMAPWFLRQVGSGMLCCSMVSARRRHSVELACLCILPCTACWRAPGLQTVVVDLVAVHCSVGWTQAQRCALQSSTYSEQHHHTLTFCCTAPLQPILEHYRGLRPPPEVQKLQRWLENIRQHPAIQATQRHPEGDQKYDQELMHHYSKYAGESAHMHECCCM